MGWNIDRFVAKETIVDELICSICSDVVENPVQTSCQHLFCGKCIELWMNQGKTTCPEDRNELAFNSLKPPSRLTLQLLNKLIIRCRNYADGCRQMYTYEDIPHLTQHELNECNCRETTLFHHLSDQLKKDSNELKTKVQTLEKEIEDKYNTIKRQERKIMEILEMIESRNHYEKKHIYNTRLFLELIVYFYLLGFDDILYGFHPTRGLFLVVCIIYCSFLLYICSKTR